MSEPYVYEADREAFMDRVKRTRAHLAKLTSGEPFDIEEWGRGMSDIIKEVDELPLVIGVRYRIRTLGGPPDPKHLHFRDEAGAIHGVDLPTTEGHEFVELEGVFRQRRRVPFGSTQLLFDVGGQYALLTDGDILRIEELPSAQA